MAEVSGPECPNCGETKQLSVERRMNGDAACIKCNWKGPHADCYRKAFNEIEAAEKALFEYHGMGPLDIQAACFAFKGFLEKDQLRNGPKSFWHSPLGRKSFILGWAYRK